MKKKSTLWIVLGALGVLVTATIVWGIFFRNYFEEQKLRKEIDRIAKLDITKEVIPMDLVTTGDYGVVEETIKSYLNEYGSLCRKIVESLDDEKLVNLLTYENYQQDGPEFQASKVYLNETKQNLIADFNSLITLTDDKRIEEALEKKTISERAEKLYHKLMREDMENEEFQRVAKDLEKTKEEVLHLIERSEKVLTFLSERKGTWTLNSGLIEFSTQEDIDTYNGLIRE